MKIHLWEIVTGLATGSAIFTAARCLKDSKDWEYACNTAHGAYDMLGGLYTNKSLEAKLYKDMNAVGLMLSESFTITINKEENIYTY